jgi:uncharacterized protein
MTRPCKCRKISSTPGSIYFKPVGIMMKDLDEVILTLDEYEAIRLADYEEYYQEQAAQSMNISRQTFGNIIGSAHKKIADFLISGKSLKIEGGYVSLKYFNNKLFNCKDCNYLWDINEDIDKPNNCPKCKSDNINKINSI